jgi:prepilin-type N-terminal cleavage/methylation domain-containing protein
MQKHGFIKRYRRRLSYRKIRVVRGKSAAAGFSLIELMIALVVLAVGVLGVWSMQYTAIEGNTTAKRITEAGGLAADRVEKLMRLPYLTDSNDPNSFPADMTPGGHTLDEPPYTLDWTVSAPDTPIDNVMTVTVTASWTEAGMDRSISYVYYKANQF